MPMMTRLSHQTDQKGKRNKAKAKEVKDGIDGCSFKRRNKKQGKGGEGTGGEGSKNWRAKERGCDHHIHTHTHTQRDAPLLSTERHWDSGTKIRPPVSPLNRPEQRTKR